MNAGFSTNLLNASVRLGNGKEGRCVAVGQSMQGFGLSFTLLMGDGTLQDAHSSTVAGVTMAPEAGVAAPVSTDKRGK